MPRPLAASRRRRLVSAALVLAVAWVAWSTWRGGGYVDEIPRMFVNPTGFVGGLKPRWSATAWWTVAVGVLIVVAAPIAAGRGGRFGPAAVGASVAAAWTVALAAPEGWAGFTRALEHRSEYRNVVPRIESPWRFVDTFVSELDGYPIHVKGHPPGMPLVLWSMDRLGWGSVRAEVVLAMAAVALSAAGLVLIAQRLAGRATAARVAPFVGITPAAVFMTTNADVFFTAVVVVTTLAAVVAFQGRGGRSVAAAGAAGLGAGAAVFLTYGAPLMLGAAALAVLRTRRAAPVVAAAAGAATVTIAFAAAGFWWPDGLEATRGFYAEGVALRRPFEFFVVSNLAVALVVMGPATIAGVATLRNRRLWWVVGPAIAGLLAADASGLSKGEVERIWLPFMAMISLAVADLCPTRSAARVAMAAQMTLGLGLQVVLTTPW